MIKPVSLFPSPRVSPHHRVRDSQSTHQGIGRHHQHMDGWEALDPSLAARHPWSSVRGTAMPGRGLVGVVAASVRRKDDDGMEDPGEQFVSRGRCCGLPWQQVSPGCVGRGHGGPVPGPQAAGPCRTGRESLTARRPFIALVGTTLASYCCYSCCIRTGTLLCGKGANRREMGCCSLPLATTDLNAQAGRCAAPYLDPTATASSTGPGR